MLEDVVTRILAQADVQPAVPGPGGVCVSNGYAIARSGSALVVGVKLAQPPVINAEVIAEGTAVAERAAQDWTHLIRGAIGPDYRVAYHAAHALDCTWAGAHVHIYPQQ